MSLFDFITEEEEPQQEVTPTDANVLRTAMKSTALGIKVAMPAEILTYDKDTMMASVQPHFKKKYNDGTVVNSPVIHNVPVAHPRAGSAFVHMPLKKGDNIMLVFQDRSMEKWTSSGGQVDPEDVRNHDLSDAVAYPGLYPSNDNVEVANNEDIIVKNTSEGGGRCEMRIKPNNHIQIINEKNELLKVLADIMRHIREARTVTGVGLQPLQHPLFAKDEERLRTFLET
jgi:hypothetical protein